MRENEHPNTRLAVRDTLLPFCKKGHIICMWFPSAVSIKRNVTASLPGKGSVNKSKVAWIVKSGCSGCGKTLDEVQKEFEKEGIM